MTSGPRAPGTAPPYGSYKSWETFLSNLKLHFKPVPRRFDVSVWNTMSFSGSTRSGIQAALSFFGLIDPQGNTNSRLEQIANPPNDTAKHRVLSSLFTEKYEPLLEKVDLPYATRLQIKEAFQRAGSAPNTAEKAVTFFTQFASDAGIQLSSALHGRGPRPKNRRRQTSGRKNGHDKSEKAAPITKNEEVSEKYLPVIENGFVHTDGLHPAILGLLKFLPTNGYIWTNLDREKAKIAFMNAIDLGYPTIEDLSERPRQSPEQDE